MLQVAVTWCRTLIGTCRGSISSLVQILFSSCFFFFFFLGGGGGAMVTHDTEFETRIKLNHNIRGYFRKCIQCIRIPNDHGYLCVLHCRRSCIKYNS